MYESENKSRSLKLEVKESRTQGVERKVGERYSINWGRTFEELGFQNLCLYWRFAVFAPDVAENGDRIAQSSGFQTLLFPLPCSLPFRTKLHELQMS